MNLMSLQECVKKLYVKFRYVPPPGMHQPADCHQVRFTKPPVIRVFTGQISRAEGRRPGESIGIDLLCTTPYFEEAGGVILVLQVSSYIEWEIEFETASAPPQLSVAPWASSPRQCLLDSRRQSVLEPPAHSPAPRGRTVRQTHRIFVSVPMAYKVPGPRLMVMAASAVYLKWYLKLPIYAAQIWSAFQKLSELERPLALVQSLKKGFCPSDVQALEAGLKALEEELNWLLRHPQYSGETTFALRTRPMPKGTAFSLARV
ncbi:MAG: hypothetical protein DCC67_17750 [Planctomycetota bacterium]|nr:MAG: hypothetical protein DCC67_17750 [Planctomycetota bacterium]